MLLNVGNLAEARKAYEDLIKINPENIKYLRGLQNSAGLPTDPGKCTAIYANEIIYPLGAATEEQLEKTLELFAEMQSKYPRSQLLKRDALNYARGDRFHKLLDSYMRPMFRKGVPSLFVSLKPLYSDPAKIAIIEQLVEDYARNLLANEHFSFATALNDATASDNTDKEPPSAYMWVMYYLAQHYDRQMQTEKAVEAIEAALRHTPTLLELVMLKARIYKHGGSRAYAAFVMNDARELDLQDRFINSKSTKYHIRNDNVERAEKSIALFARVSFPIKFIVLI
jgi:peptide alpha-N-acetyltransferase